MRLRTRIDRVRLGADEYRVVRPSPPPRRAVLFDHVVSVQMLVDRRAAETLTAAVALAARSRRSLVYLPMRANTPPATLEPCCGDPVLWDLVLLHHSLRFPISRWRRVRGRLRSGRPHTVRLPNNDPPGPEAVDHDWIRFREYRDHLRFAAAAHTLFVVGSPTAFRTAGAWVRDLMEEAPSFTHRHPRQHYCAELTPGPWAGPWSTHQVPGLWHIEYAPRW